MKYFAEVRDDDGEVYQIEFDTEYRLGPKPLILRVNFAPTGDDDPGFTEIVMNAAVARIISNVLRGASNVFEASQNPGMGSDSLRGAEG